MLSGGRCKDGAAHGEDAGVSSQSNMSLCDGEEEFKHVVVVVCKET